MVTRAIYVSLYICQWMVPQWYKHILTSSSCNLLYILLICQQVKELVLSLPLWFRVECSIVQGQTVISSPLWCGGSQKYIRKYLHICLSYSKRVLYYYSIKPLRDQSWPCVTPIAGLPHLLCAVLAHPSTKTEAPVPHCSRSTDWVLQKQVVHLLFPSLYIHSLTLFQVCPYF